MANIKISRQGLTRCPACSTHIQVAAVLAKTVCPFCKAELGRALATAGEGGASPLQRLAGSGRSALIAASMMGMPLVACADGEDGAAGPVDVMSADSMADVGGEPGMDIIAEPVYGMPAEDVGPSQAEDVSANQADVPMDMPVYGMPADDLPPEAPEED